ncbi:MAG: Gldg family protein [Proteobacteria bacterium]|nr:Gldg family protein [Pseudomonadota bacterium]
MKYISNLDRKTLTVAGLVTAILFLFAINILATSEVRNAQLDLTDNKLFTLSDGTREVIQSIDEPITLRYYYSRKLGDISAPIGNYENRVRELLQHYASVSNGKIDLKIINPAPFSIEEDEAVKFGIQGIPLDQTGEPGYFGLAATNSTDDRKLITFFNQAREQFLEYDLTRLIFDLASPDKKKVGMITSLLLEADPMLQYKPWPLIEQIQQFFEVKSLDLDVKHIPDDIDVLFLVHPKISSEQTLYAIDQFVLRGGKAVILVDPHNESARMSPRMPPGAGSSDLKKLFDVWGIAYDPEKFVGDRANAIRVSANINGRDVVADYLSWLNYDSRALNPKDVVTAQLNALALASAGHLEQKEGATTEFIPLLKTSAISQRITTEKVSGQPDPAAILRDFKSENKVFNIAARVSGKVKSAFPDGPPPAPKDEKKDAAKDDKDKKEPVKREHLTDSKTDIQLLVIADTDLLSSQFWLRQQNFFGQTMNVPIANNADFVVNALDNLSGSGSLISLRSRGLSQRPFVRILNLQNEAEDKYQETERGLQKELEELQKKMQSGNVNRGPDSQGRIVVTAAQQKAFGDFRKEMTRVRKELRDVQGALRADIEKLDTTLKAINIWAVPILVAIIAIVLAIVRRRRYRQTAI